jgi:hypothetical protein
MTVDVAERINIQIKNNCDSGNCVVAVQLKSDYYLLWNGNINAGDSGTLEIDVTLTEDLFPESQATKLTFYCGYLISETEMAVTDDIAFDVLVKVPTIDWMTYAIYGGIGVGVLAIIMAVAGNRKQAYYPPQRYGGY